MKQTNQIETTSAESGGVANRAGGIRVTRADSVSLLVVDSDFGSDAGEWLEALAERRMARGDDALVVELTAAVPLSGHALGSLRRLAAAAEARGIRLGVAAQHPLAEAIRTTSHRSRWRCRERRSSTGCGLGEPEPVATWGSGAPLASPDARTLSWTHAKRMLKRLAPSGPMVDRPACAKTVDGCGAGQTDRRAASDDPPALDSPTNCGEIALSVDLGPSGATHDLRCLEAAGLINRRRVGRKVIVERTPLGHGLLALYERP